MCETWDVNPNKREGSVRSRSEVYFMLFSSFDGMRKVWDGRLFSLFVMCDRSLRTVPCHSFYGVSKIEVTGESLANVRTKWEAVEQRAQPFFEDHYDWPESIPHIPGLVWRPRCVASDSVGRRTKVCWRELRCPPKVGELLTNGTRTH